MTRRQRPIAKVGGVMVVLLLVVCVDMALLARFLTLTHSRPPMAQLHAVLPLAKEQSEPNGPTGLFEPKAPPVAEVLLRVPRENGNWDRPLDQKTVVILRGGDSTPFGRCMGMTVRGGEGSRPELRFDPPDTMDRVRKYLQEIRATSDQAKAKIDADPSVPQIYVVHVLDLMAEVGFQDISYSGLRESLLERLLEAAPRSR